LREEEKKGDLEEWKTSGSRCDKKKQKNEIE